MAADPTLAGAYGRYFQAQSQADLMQDPFYQFSQIAARAAQEWQFEKKKDQERAKKKAERSEERRDEMFNVALDGWNGQTRELAHNHVAVFTEKMNQAILNKDKKAQATIEGDSRAFAAELQKGQSIIKAHGALLRSGALSKGANVASLNKLVAGEDTDYQVYVETDPEKPNYNKIFLQVKDENGGIQLMGLDDFADGAIPRDDKLATQWNSVIKAGVNESIKYGVPFDEGQMERTIDQALASRNTVVSAYYDDLFGQGQSLRDKWVADTKAGGGQPVESWSQVSNTQPVNTDPETKAFQPGGFDEDRLREYVKSNMMQIARKEHKDRLTSYQRKLSADAKTSQKERDTFQVGQNTWIEKSIAQNIAKNIKNRATVVAEGRKYIPQGTESWIDEKGNEYPNNQALIFSMDQNRGYGFRNHPLFTSLIKPTL